MAIKMFDKKDASFEIAKSMEQALVSSAMEKHEEQINKFAKALDYLNSVAEIFDELGLNKEAEATTTLLEVVAAKKKKKPSKSSKSKSKKSTKPEKSDSAMKGLTSKKMLRNLEEKGWMFNADDAHRDSCMCSMCMDADDNYHYDTESDASYNIDRDDNYVEELEDFEDEVDVPTLPSTPVAKKHHDDEDEFDEQAYWDKIKRLID